MNDVLLIVLLITLISLLHKGYFGESRSNSNLGRYTSQAEIWTKSSVGYFKDAAELS